MVPGDLRPIAYRPLGSKISQPLERRLEIRARLGAQNGKIEGREAKGEGMKHEPGGAPHGPILAVERVSQDGMAQGPEMDPYLVAPAGLGLHLQQSRPRERLARAVAGEGGPAPGAQPHAARAKGPEGTADLAPGIEAAQNDGQVDLAHAAGLEFKAEPPVHGGVLGQDQEPAGLAVKPVDHEELSSPKPLQLLPERLPDLSSAGDDGLPRRLGDGQEAVVLMDDPQAYRLRGPSDPVRAHAGPRPLRAEGPAFDILCCMALAKLLLVDDEPLVLEVTSRLLEKAGYAVRQAPSAEAALALARSEPFDAVLMDVSLPGMSGLRALSQMGALTKAPILLITGHYDPELEKDALLLGARALLPKPIDSEALVAALQRALA